MIAEEKAAGRVILCEPFGPDAEKNLSKSTPQTSADRADFDEPGVQNWEGVWWLLFPLEDENPVKTFRDELQICDRQSYDFMAAALVNIENQYRRMGELASLALAAN